MLILQGYSQELLNGPFDIRCVAQKQLTVELIKFVAVFLILAIPGIGCQTRESETAKIAIITGKVNEQKLSIIHSTTTEVESEVKALNSTNKSEVELILHSKPEFDGVLISLQYQRFHINLLSENREQTITTENGENSFDPVEKVLASLKGATLEIQLDSTRNLLSVAGSKEITDKVLAAVSNYDAQTKNKVQEQLSRLIGEEFIKSNFAEMFKLLPDTAITIGQSWRKRDVQNAQLSFELNTTYTLKSINDSIAHITAKSEIAKVTSTKNATLPAQATTELDGTQDGYYDLDLKSMIVIKSESSLHIQGKILAMGREIPVKVKITKKITSKKL